MADLRAARALLAECLGRVAGGDVRLHQRAVAGLAEGLELGDLGRMSNCVPERPLAKRCIAQAFERAHEDVAEAAPLILDLAWPDGVQTELTEPVALLLNEPPNVHSVAAERGFRSFTSVDALKTYINAEVLNGQAA